MVPDEIKKADKITLRKFGLVMALPLLIIAILLFWRNRESAPYFLILSGIFAILGLIIPKTLKWIYIAWMTLAYFVGTVMSYVILTMFFIFVLTPGGFLLGLVRKDPLARKFPGNQSSYWVPAQEYPDELDRYSKPY